MNKVRPGYTLFEIILVVLILVVVAGISIPVISTMMQGSRINAAKDSVRAQLAKTRNQAVSDNIPYRFAVKYNTGNFKIAPDTVDFWPDAVAESSLPMEGQEEPFVLEGSLPEGVCFCGSENGNGQSGQNWDKIATFYQDGTASEDAEIHLAIGRGTPVVIRLNAASGTITAQLSFSGRAFGS